MNKNYVFGNMLTKAIYSVSRTKMCLVLIITFPIIHYIMLKSCYITATQSNKQIVIIYKFVKSFYSYAFFT